MPGEANPFEKEQLISHQFRNAAIFDNAFTFKILIFEHGFESGCTSIINAALSLGVAFLQLITSSQGILINRVQSTT